MLTMPAVFAGSFFGVILGKMLSNEAKVILFGTTVAWSIKTTGQKAIALLAKEK